MWKNFDLFVGLFSFEYHRQTKRDFFYHIYPRIRAKNICDISFRFSIFDDDVGLGVIYNTILLNMRNLHLILRFAANSFWPDFFFFEILHSILHNLFVRIHVGGPLALIAFFIVWAMASCLVFFLLFNLLRSSFYLNFIIKQKQN